MIAVVGGGVSGLAAGWELARSGADAVVYEGGPRTGGLIGSLQLDGQVLELGPQRVRLTPPLARLIAALGLSDGVIQAPSLPLFVWADGRLRPVPVDVPSALTSDLIGWADRARALLEPLTGGLRAGETAAEYFSRKLGRRTYRRVIAPLYGGLYASDPADMPARYAVAPLLAALGVQRTLLPTIIRGLRSGHRSPAVSFRSGLQTFTDALAAALGPRLRVGTTVHEIHRDGRGFRLLAGDDEVRVDRVVLACPAAAAGRALSAMDPELGRRLRRLHYNPLATVHLRSDADLQAMGYQPTLGPRYATHGVTSNHALFGRDRVYTAFLGGAKRPEVPSLPDHELAAHALEDFRLMTGHDAAVLHIHRTAMPAWDRSWEALDGMRLPPGIDVCANWRARPGITGRLMDAARLAADVRPAPVPAVG